MIWEEGCPECAGDAEPREHRTFQCVKCGLLFPAPTEDMLKDMVARNKLFTDYVREKNPLNVNIGDTMSWLAFNGLALGAEWGEVIRELPWKWWKTQDMDGDRVAGELIDMFHFMFDMLDELGYGPEEIWMSYVAKNEENWRRFRENWES